MTKVRVPQCGCDRSYELIENSQDKREVQRAIALKRNREQQEATWKSP
ncbi:hypothetical protein VB735_13145 [Halotia wernerae UHCC 0503]|nr:hypothetical protein [Halotia wernerae UHCC 0503]